MTASSWHTKMLRLAKEVANWSKDPSTKVGCVITDAHHVIKSTGFNGFPRGFSDDGRLGDRESKYRCVVHAEENAIVNAARTGAACHGGIVYVTFRPCQRCARLIIQLEPSAVIVQRCVIPERWAKDMEASLDLFIESRIPYDEVCV